MDDTLLLAARALVLADLQARHRATPEAVDALEDACANRGWWAEQWPEGQAYVAGLVAQDVQDALFESVGRWPLCVACDTETPEQSIPATGFRGRVVRERGALAAVPGVRRGGA